MTHRPAPGLVIEDLFRMRWIEDAQIAPTGHRLAYVETTLDASGDRVARKVFVRPLDEAAPLRIAPNAASAWNPRWSPDGRQLAVVVEDDHGNQIWLADPATGSARRVTNVTGSASEPAWSADSRQIAFTVSRNEDGAVRHRVNVIRADGSGWRMLDFAHSNWAPQWSPDGSRLAFLAQVGEHQELWQVDGDLGNPLHCAGGVATVNAFIWAPEGNSLAYLGLPDGNATDDNQRLWIVDGPGGLARELTANMRFSVGQAVRGDDPRGSGLPTMCWSSSTGHIYVELSLGGTGPLGWFDAQGNTGVLFAGEHVCLSPSVSREGSVLAFILSTGGDPGDIYVAHESGRGLRRITFSNGWLDELAAPMKQLEVNRGEVTIDAWITGGSEAFDAPRPLIVNVHGGPHYAVGWRFTFEVQRLAAQGAAVLTLNPRGSQGYGEDFARAIRGDWGGIDYDDVNAVVDVAAATAGIDSTRIVIWGVSYGGFMAQWALTRTNRYCLGISENGISNLLGLWALGAGRPHGWDVPMGGPPWASDLYLQRSPLRYADRIHTPLLLVHAEDDQVCPVAQSEQMHAALCRLDRQVDFVRLPGEGHLINLNGRPSSRLRRATAVDRHIPFPTRKD